MKKKISAPAFLLCVIIFASCAGQNNASLLPLPDESYFETEKNVKTIDTSNIIETKDGMAVQSMPDWLLAFLEGGIERVERMDSYSDKYVFIGRNDGENFTALNKWADNYSAMRDFPMLAAARIEKRMILTSSLYPDDEYGIFFERMVLNAYSGEYQGAVKEDIFWIKIKVDSETIESENSAPSETYNFFILITIDRTMMRVIITNMMTRILAAISPAPSGARAAAIERLRQTFFEGF